MSPQKPKARCLPRPTDLLLSHTFVSSVIVGLAPTSRSSVPRMHALMHAYTRLHYAYTPGTRAEK
eukprot:3888682-Prymnesium_polylepis.1